ncbi:hypothetical protein EMIT036CA2_20002 [Chryseobacterium sp. IT-36CA2]
MLLNIEIITLIRFFIENYLFIVLIILKKAMHHECIADI